MKKAQSTYDLLPTYEMVIIVRLEFVLLTNPAKTFRSIYYVTWYNSRYLIWAALKCNNTNG